VVVAFLGFDAERDSVPREIALGEKGAERLLGKGHLAAKLEGEPEIIFGQVPFVDSDFLAQVVEGLK
jgi:S-DNA-T family DNA segregation ATPase FtsK/SpoIIIE